MGLTFNQTTAIFGVLYAVALFYFFRKLKMVWKREADRHRVALALFTVLFLVAGAAIAYVRYLIKKKRYLERKAADLIQKEKNKPFKVKRTNYFGTFVKIFTALLLTFIVIHRIMRKT